MKIPVWVSVEKEVEVDVSFADFVPWLRSKSDADSANEVREAVMAAHGVLRDLTPEMIGLMSVRQRRIVGEALAVESARWLADAEEPQEVFPMNESDLAEMERRAERATARALHNHIRRLNTDIRDEIRLALDRVAPGWRLPEEPQEVSRG